MRAALLAFALTLPLHAEVRGQAGRVLEIAVDTPVEPVTVEIVSRGLEEASRKGDALVILRLSTPGGLMDSMRAILSRVEASTIPVVTFVGPSGARAASAGFFLLEAGDVAAMAPATNTGAAHPVSMNGEMEPTMKLKVLNDAAAAMRGLAAKRGRNVAMAESAVAESKSFTEREALDGHVIEVIARDERDLLTQLNGRVVKRFNGSTVTLHTAHAEVAPLELTLREKVLVALTDPNLAMILLVLGALGIYMEFNAPGMIFPGVLGAICGLLAMASLAVLPLTWLGAALLTLALVLFGLEMKFTSHGALGAGGAVAMVLGCMLLVDGPIPEMRIRWLTAAGIVLPFAVVTAFLVTLAARAKRNKAVTGVGAMQGTTGVAVEDLQPSGRVFAHGEYWNAHADAAVKAGERVRIVSQTGLELKVQRMANS